MVSTRSSSGMTPRAPRTSSSEIFDTPTPATRTRRTVSTKSLAASSAAASGWTHQLSLVTAGWLAIAIPLVIWDASYVFLRPHSMPGGFLHWPWAPYELYGRVDHMYGKKQFDAHNGFTAAQSAVNVIETVMYIVYLYIVSTYGSGTGVQKVIGGRKGATAVLVLFTALVMTVSKTLLYGLNEYYSGFDNIGHNTFIDLFFLWIIPNGAWVIVPSIIISQVVPEMVNGLASAPPAVVVKSE